MCGLLKESEILRKTRDPCNVMSQNTDPAVTKSGTGVPSSARERVRIFDTTLRDGEQSPGFSMSRPQKLHMAHALAELGVDVLEAGFPQASDGDFEAVRAIAKEVRGPIICGLARAQIGDIDACARALEPAASKRIHVFLATSPLHRRHKLNMSREQVVETGIKAIAACAFAVRRCRVLGRRCDSHRTGIPDRSAVAR